MLLTSPLPFCPQVAGEHVGVDALRLSPVQTPDEVPHAVAVVDALSRALARPALQMQHMLHREHRGWWTRQLVVDARVTGSPRQPGVLCSVFACSTVYSLILLGSASTASSRSERRALLSTPLALLLLIPGAFASQELLGGEVHRSENRHRESPRVALNGPHGKVGASSNLHTHAATSTTENAGGAPPVTHAHSTAMAGVGAAAMQQRVPSSTSKWWSVASGAGSCEQMVVT